MVDTLLADLFSAHKPGEGGALAEPEVAQLDRLLARLHSSGAGGRERDPQRVADERPPEPLPRAPLSFAQFRGHMYRVLADRCGADADEEKERLLEELLTWAAQPDLSREVPALLLSDLSPGLSPEVQPNLEERAVDSPCWAPNLNGVYDMAKGYGTAAIVASKSFSEQLMAGESAAWSLLRRILHTDDCVHGGQAQHGVHPRDHPGRGPWSDGGPPGIAIDRSIPPVEIPHLARWRFAAPDGLHINVRATPDVNGPWTGEVLQPGEVFQVISEIEGADGILYLMLADGRGWVFEQKPGVGVLCVRAGRAEGR